MGSLLRSEEMALCQLFLQSEAAYACVSELGELGLLQFRDLNPDVSAFQRKFVNEVRRCDEMERKLRFLEKEVRKDGIPMLDTGDNPDAPAPREMIDLEATFEKLENEMKEVNKNSEALKRNYLELTELRHILKKTRTFFEEAELHHQALNDPALGEESMGLLGEEVARVNAGQALRLGFVAGVIIRERIPAFERMLWRACRGNVFLRQAEIDTPLEDPVTGDQVSKSVFIIFFQGDQLKLRVKKICEGFRATLYPCPETQAERREMEMGVATRIEDLNTVLAQTQEHRHRVLVAAAKNIKVWFVKVRKIKAIYHTLNMFNLDVTQKCLIAECWCPVDDLDRIQQALRRGTERSGSSVPSILNRMGTKQTPPTYNRNNKFTRAFQAIIDAYGVANYREINPVFFKQTYNRNNQFTRAFQAIIDVYGVANYREINPAPFTVITFPFLFAVMFGDLGHGFIMFLFALWMVVREKRLMAKKSDDEIWNTMFGGRYMILLMGIFSCYTGFLYNDVFSKSLNIFGSQWTRNLSAYKEKDLVGIGEGIMLLPRNNYEGSPYPIGVDPIWQLCENKITYTNSLKMKMSIILGICHMYFGIILSLFNYRYFKQRINIYCLFIPQVLFLFCMFGYLVILIFSKWIYFDESSSDKAPSLLVGIINMFMFKIDAKKMYGSQQGMEHFLVLVVMACVPWMLLSKPLILRRRHLQKRGSSAMMSDIVTAQSNMEEGNDSNEVTHHDGETVRFEEFTQEENEVMSIQSGDIISSHGDDADGDSFHCNEEFVLSEVLIESAIHTMEFCMNCVSHSASYLRLWALSLAHAQLSEVLWGMVMALAFRIENYGGAVMMVFVFMFWACLTIFVLLIMEGLSAFLHALRLHWIEFQSKFYHGEGHIFKPFSFDDIMEVVPAPDD